jgi:hypothetical protein
VRLGGKVPKIGQKIGNTGGVSMRAREEQDIFSRKTEPEPYRIHPSTFLVSVEQLNDAALNRMAALYRPMPGNRQTLLHALFAVGIEDKGQDEDYERGFVVAPFNRARLVAWYAEIVGERSRLYPAEVHSLKQFELLGYVTSWRHALRQDTYIGAGGQLLTYSAGYELRYQITPAAAFWYLLNEQGPWVRQRAKQILRDLRERAGIMPGSYQAKGE